MEKSSNRIKYPSLRGTFMQDLNTLSNALSDDCFDKVVLLFIRKWEDIPQASHTLEHLRQEWLIPRLRRIYRGAAHGMVMNNNGLESTNRVLKDTSTFHEVMPILEFLPVMKTWIGSESKRRHPDNVNYIKFAVTPDITLKDMTDGFALMQENMTFKRVQDHFIAATSNTIGLEELSSENVLSVFDQYRTSNFKSMDRYNSFQHHVHVVTLWLCSGTKGKRGGCDESGMLIAYRGS